MKNALLLSAAVILCCASICGCWKRNGVTESSNGTDKKKVRNPFKAKDVRDPDGKDVQAFAAEVKLPGDDKDPNAEQWADNATAGKKESLDGEWSSRWNGGSAEKEWITGTATVKQVGSRVFILHKDQFSTYLIDAKLQAESRLVGRYQNQKINGDSRPWVGKIVNDERIDGEWTEGRWDLRRKIAEQ